MKLLDRKRARRFNHRFWGNWQYMDYDHTINWRGRFNYCVHSFNNVRDALEWQAHMNKTWLTKEDRLDLAKAFAELFDEPQLTTHHLVEFRDIPKIIAELERNK